MGSLKKNDVVPSVEKVMTPLHELWDSAIHNYASSFGSDSKDIYGITPEMAHALVRSYLGESPSTPNYILDRDICKKILDKYEQADKIKEEKKQAVQRAFHNPFYVVGADSEHSLLVAKVKRELVDVPNSARKETKYAIVEDFRRVPNLDEFPDIIPIATMFKASTEGKFQNDHVFGGFIPRESNYWKDIEVLTACRNFPSNFFLTWMLIPCSQT
jgi:hypothetical protein